MYCLDANVWVYFFDSGLDEHERVRDAVTTILAEEPVFTTTVLQMEVVHYLTKQLAESESSVDRFLRLDDVTVAELTTGDVDRAATLLADHDQTGIGGRDGTVLAAMERHDVERLWTHAEGLKRLEDRLDWLTVTDPVE
jgi:predicted nucleic acid-binding protein